MSADQRHPADDLVPGHDGIFGTAPLVACGVDVGVADAAKEDVNYDVLVARLAPLESEWFQRGVGRISGEVLGHEIEASV